MVDVAGKRETARMAVASLRLRMRPDLVRRIREDRLEKGNALEMARVAGILAAKRTADLLPLCHPVRITEVTIDFDLAGSDAVEVRASVRGKDRTGFEMEALTAVSIAGLALYDACKRHQRDVVISDLVLEEKRGGRSGDWARRPGPGKGPGGRSGRAR